MVNVAFVTPDKHLVLPAFDKILGGCTAKRVLALAPRLVESGLLAGVSTRTNAAWRWRSLAAASSCCPSSEWDDKPIGYGT